MGVTINSKNKSIDMGYGGFNRLRTTIGDLLPQDLAEHYKELEKGMFIFGEAKEEFFKEYDNKTKELDKKHEYKYNKILHFLYACDCGSEMKVDVCEDLHELIKDYDDDFLYGYTGRKDCAKFKDFKEIVKDCVDNKCDMEWY